jgi:hypothetical protein
MVNKKSEYNPALEITQLKIKCQSLEAKLRAVQEGRPIADNLPERVENLRHSLQTLKLRMQRDPQLDDNFRKLALETELGRLLLIMDGTL